MRKIIKEYITPKMFKYLAYVSVFHFVMYLLPLTESDTLIGIYFSAIGVFAASSLYYTAIINNRSKRKIPAFETLSGLWLTSLLLGSINVITIITNWQIINSGVIPFSVWNHITTLLYSYTAWIFLVVAFEGSRGHDTRK